MVAIRSGIARVLRLISADRAFETIYLQAEAKKGAAATAALRWHLPRRATAKLDSGFRRNDDLEARVSS
jgi:hypothetical protein